MRFVVLLLLVVSGLPSSAAAQIINTLRGFDRQALGWSGSVEGAVAIADGNTDYIEYLASGSIQWRSEHQRWVALGRYMRRSASDALIAEDRMTHLRHNYRMRPWLATVLFLQGQHDPFRRIQTRLLAGGGLRFDVVRRAQWEAAVGATVMLEGDELTEDDRGMVTNERLSFFASVYRSASDDTEVDLVAFFQPRASDPSDVRAFAAASIEVDIIGGLYFLFRYNLTHDSNPPPGVRRTDQSLRSGLGFKL